MNEYERAVRNLRELRSERLRSARRGLAIVILSITFAAFAGIMIFGCTKKQTSREEAFDVLAHDLARFTSALPSPVETEWRIVEQDDGVIYLGPQIDPIESAWL